MRRQVGGSNGKEDKGQVEETGVTAKDRQGKIEAQQLRHTFFARHALQACRDRLRRPCDPCTWRTGPPATAMGCTLQVPNILSITGEKEHTCNASSVDREESIQQAMHRQRWPMRRVILLLYQVPPFPRDFQLHPLDLLTDFNSS